MLIDVSYFAKNGPRHIQNATLDSPDSLPQPGKEEVREAIEGYIAMNQEQFLWEMLGSSVGSKVNGYLVCRDEEEGYKAIEHMEMICNRLKESFADYVFYKILRDSNEQPTMTGLVMLDTKNEYVSPIKRQVTVWNMMVERNRRFKEWAASAECPVSGISVSDNLTTKINSFNL